MRELSHQLHHGASQLTGTENLARCGFRILYGMKGIVFSQKGQKGSTTVHLLLPNSAIIPVCVHWRSQKPIQAPVYQQDLSEVGIVFQWGKDFPREQIIRVRREITSPKNSAQPIKRI